MKKEYEYEVEEFKNDVSSQRTNNVCGIKILDREGQICNCGDTLYDKYGYEYCFRGIEYVEPHGLFQRFISVGKAGYKAILSLRASDELHYADTIYVELKWASEWYSHKRFGKGLKNQKNK